MTKSEKTSSILALSAILILLISCSGIESLFGSKDDKPSIPSDIVDLAEGIFSLIGLVFESSSDDPTLDTTYPAGMTVSWDTRDTVLRINLTNFSPPDQAGSTLKANGSVTLTRISTAPYTIDIGGTITFTGYKYNSVVINGRAVWAAGKEPGDEGPKTVTGTFKVDGKSYNLTDIIEAIKDREDGGGTPTPPAVFNPLPEIFRTSLGNFSQRFNSRVSRAYPAVAGDPWSQSGQIGFDISDDGTKHAVYRNNSETGEAGFIHWSTVLSTKIDFWDSNKTKLLYSYTVLSFSANRLRLLGPSGQSVEWIFSAGKNNLTGIVVDASNKPLADAQVELGSVSGSSFTRIGTPAITDANGFFEFSNLSQTPGLPEGFDPIHMRVTKSAYTTYQGEVGGSRVPKGTLQHLQLYQFVTMNPE